MRLVSAGQIIAPSAALGKAPNRRRPPSSRPPFHAAIIREIAVAA
jgi:hypothetical protein